MNKHKFNIFPEAKPEDFARLRDDIRESGFDQKQPVIVYEGAILDGWNRWRACKEIGITPAFRQFDGSDSDAIAYVMRTNKRRNLNSGQWATIAVEAEDIIKAIAEQVEKERRQNQAKTQAGAIGTKLSRQPDEQKTANKAAELFNTCGTYVKQAAKIKAAAPDVFEKVKAGRMTMQDATKAVRAIPTEPWLEDEVARKAKVENGQAVVANAQRDKNLIQWAEGKGLAVRIDRGTEFGNPFIKDVDGTRDEVCDWYANHYLPHKRSIRAKIHALKGRVLICHCYPERCHGESLIETA